MRLAKLSAAAGLLLVSLYTHTAVVAQQPGASDSGKKCEVTVDRSQESGVFDVTRQELSNGECICYIYTGPQPQPGGTEGQVNAIVNSRSCPGAKVMELPVPEGIAGRGFFGGPLVPLLGLAGIGTGAAASNSGGGNPLSP